MGQAAQSFESFRAEVAEVVLGQVQNPEEAAAAEGGFGDGAGRQPVVVQVQSVQGPRKGKALPDSAWPEADQGVVMEIQLFYNCVPFQKILRQTANEVVL